MSIKPLSRFWATSSSESSEGGSDSESSSTPPSVSPATMFVKYVNSTPSEVLKSSKKDTIIERFIEDTSQEDSVDAVYLLEQYVERTAPEDLLSRSSGEVVKEWITEVKKLPDSPTRRLQGKGVRKIQEVAAKKISTASPNTATFHRAAYDSLNSPLVRSAVKLSQKPPEFPEEGPSPFITIINIEHIVEGEISKKKPVGFHFCPRSHPKRGLLSDVQINPATGVFCGSYSIGRHVKFSSFFPDFIKDEDDLVKVIQASTFLIEKGNRKLYLAQEAPPFYIEWLVQEDGAVIQSAYPIFFVDYYAEKKNFQITGTVSLSSENIIDLLSSPEIIKDNIVYEDGTKRVVDIAPLTQDLTGVKQGVYIIFTRT